MRSLGLVNTFMAVPYDAVAVATRPSTYQTPANSREDINTNPDPTMQTTAEEIGTALAMLYYCAQGEGGFLAVYPEQMTQEERQTAGLVYSPNGDYVIMIYLAQPESDWLSADYSFPIIREIARAAYNYFNFDHPYLDSALDGTDRTQPPQPPLTDPVGGNQ